MQAGFWIVLLILAVGGIFTLFVYGKNKKIWLSIMLCMVMVAGMAVAAVPVQAADRNGDIELSCTVLVDGKDAEITATVSYVIYDEAEEAVEPSEENSESGDASEEDGESGDASEENGESGDASEEVGESGDASGEDGEDEPTVQPMVLHVSVDGTAPDGCSEENHYAGIAAVRDALRDMDHNDKPVEVLIHAGSYEFSETVTFEATDSGSADYPITYKAAGDGEVIFTGAKELDITKFATVTEENDATAFVRIPEKVRGQVQVMSLDDSGIAADILNFRTRYTQSSHSLTMPYLYLNEERQTISRWPNDGFETATTVLETGTTIGTKACFEYEGLAPDKWTTADNAYVVGYLGNDYNVDWVKVDSINVTENTITVSDKANYGIQTGARWYAANLLEEIDLPGEYYIDVTANKLYYYPAHALESTDKLELTAYDKAFIKVTGASYINFEGIHFTHTLDDGIRIVDGSSNITIQDCELNDIGSDGIEIFGRNNKIDGCTIYETGLFAINITGGADRTNYIPSNNVISNNHFWNYATQSLMLWKYAISLGRNTQNQVIGDVVEYNIFHGQPGAGAILYGGLDNQIRYNEMYALSSDCADAGIIYCGRRYYEAGNVISYNYIHDYGSSYANGWEVQAIYFDDTQPFQTAIRNIIVPNNTSNTASNLMTGSYNTFSENIIVGAAEGYQAGDRNTQISSGAESSINTAEAMTEAILAKHPEIQTVKNWIYANGKKVPVFYNTLQYNLNVNVEKSAASSIAQTVKDAEGAQISGNVDIDVEDYSTVFVDAANHDYRLTTAAMTQYGFPATMINENNFEMSDIGIQTAVTKPAEAFALLYPTKGQTDVYTRDLWLKWEEAQFADEYYYEVATDAAFTDSSVVKSGTVVRPVVELTGLENDKTYYYRVTAKNTSKQLGNAWSCVEAYSFTTIAEEPLNTVALEENLDILKSVNVLENIDRTDLVAGKFKSDIEEPYNDIVATADALLNNADNTATQDAIDEATEKLAAFIETINCYKIVGTVELLTADRQWTGYDGSAKKDPTLLEGGGQLLTAATGTTMMYPMDVQENYYIYKFKMIPNRLTGYAALTLRQTDLTKMPYKTVHGYNIVILDNGYELFKRTDQGGEKLAYEYTSSVEEGGTAYSGPLMVRTTGNDATEYTVEFGAVDVLGENNKPGVRIYFKVNDKVVFDYVDTDNPIFGEGRFTAYGGGVSDGKSSALKLMPITPFEVVIPGDEPEEIEKDGIYYTDSGICLVDIDSFELLKDIYSISEGTYRTNLDELTELLNLGE